MTDGEESRVAAITGATGLIGGALRSLLERQGWRVLRLVRREARSADEVEWSPQHSIDAARLEGVDALIHLAGESLSQGRWTEARKQRLWDSRVLGTRTVVAGLERLTKPPKVFVCASAIGYYGDRSDELLTEDSPGGTGFLAQLCEAWEAEASKASSFTRTACTRFGVVLDAQAGGLAKMLPFFKAGIGGRVGDGTQYFSWVSRHDTARALLHVIEHAPLDGPVNVVGPCPVTNAEFTQVLARAVHRPAILPVPAFGIRLAFGEFAQEALASLRVVPRRLLDNGFEFTHASAAEAVRSALAA